MYPGLLFFPKFNIDFGLDLSLQAVGLSLHHENKIVNKLIINFFVLRLLDLKSQVSELTLFLFKLPL